MSWLSFIFSAFNVINSIRYNFVRLSSSDSASIQYPDHCIFMMYWLQFTLKSHWTLDGYWPLKLKMNDYYYCHLGIAQIGENIEDILSCCRCADLFYGTQLGQLTGKQISYNHRRLVQNGLSMHIKDNIKQVSSSNELLIHLLFKIISVLLCNEDNDDPSSYSTSSSKHFL